MQFGLMDLYDLGQLVLARDTAGTFFWLVQTGATRYLGPLAEPAVDLWRDAVLSWSPWLDPEWPPIV